jgi:hypothetical protein
MAITSRDQLIAALTLSRNALIDKASLSNTVAGRFHSLWCATGVPGQGAIPTTAAVCTRATTGALPLTNQTAPVATYLAWLELATANSATNLSVHDRLCHQGGLSGTVASPTAQTTNLPLNLTGVSIDRIGPTDLSELTWWLEWYTDTGATGVNATLNLTYADNTTGDVVIALAATSRASGLYPILPATGKTGIKAVNSLTLSASTGTAGSFGVTCTRFLTGTTTMVANKSEIRDWAGLGLPVVPNDACLSLLMFCSTTSTGAVRGLLKLAVG